MNRFLKLLGLLLGLGLVQAADATTRVASCDGCTFQQSKNAARYAVSSGIVYVFDANSATTRKFQVYQHWMDDSRRTSQKVVRSRAVESDIEAAYENYIDSFNAVAQGASIVLPPDFPIHSVGGAFVDPEYTSTGIEQYLNGLPLSARWRTDLINISWLLLQKSVPLLNLDHILKPATITVEFADGSSQRYTVTYSANLTNGELIIQTEVEPAGNALLANGQPAPTTRFSFRNMRFEDTGDALSEWAAWAHSLGIRIATGVDNQPISYMICMEEKNETICVMFNQP